MRDASPAARFRELTILAIALAAGPTLFAALVLALDLGSRILDPGLITPLWAGVAAASVAGAVVLWRSRVQPMLPGLGAPVPREGVDAGRLRTTLVILWALLEGQALFGVVAYYLTLDLVPMVGLPVAWVGILLSRPRRAWFGR